MLHHHRLRMREVPVRMFQRGGGVSSISSGKSAYYMVKVLLAIFVGLARAPPVAEPGDAAPGGRGAGDLMEVRIQIVAIVGSRRAAAGRARAGAPPAAARALRAAVAVQRARAARPRDLAGRACSELASASASSTRQRAVLHRASGSSCCCCCTSRRRVAPGGPDEGPRAAAGAAGGAAPGARARPGGSTAETGERSRERSLARRRARAPGNRRHERRARIENAARGRGSTSNADRASPTYGADLRSRARGFDGQACSAMPLALT